MRWEWDAQELGWTEFAYRGGGATKSTTLPLLPTLNVGQQIDHHCSPRLVSHLAHLSEIPIPGPAQRTHNRQSHSTPARLHTTPQLPLNPESHITWGNFPDTTAGPSLGRVTREIIRPCSSSGEEKGLEPPPPDEPGP